MIISKKWYQSRTIHGALIGGFFVILAVFIAFFLENRDKQKDKESISQKEKRTSIFPVDTIQIFDKSTQKIDSTKKKLPISIEIVPNVTNKQVPIVMNRIRSDKKLRRLTPIESGKNISNTPCGTFFFIDGVYLSVTKNAIDHLIKKDGIVERSQWNPASVFELHYTPKGEIFIIAFVSSETVSRFSKLDGVKLKDASLFSFPWTTFNNMILLPLDRVMESNCRTISDENYLSIDVLDVIVQ